MRTGIKQLSEDVEQLKYELNILKRKVGCKHTYRFDKIGKEYCVGTIGYNWVMRLDTNNKDYAQFKCVKCSDIIERKLTAKEKESLKMLNII